MMEVHAKELAQTIAKNEGLLDVQVDVKPGSQKGDGFLGEILMVTIKERNGKQLDLIFKCALTNETIVTRYHIKPLYENELHFYNKIFPTIKHFQKQHGVSHPFTAVAKYYGSHFEGTIRIIVLENLRARGFELFDKKETVDCDHAKRIFTQYGKFHAFSFAYRDEYPEEFESLAGKLVHNWDLFSQGEDFALTLDQVFEHVTELFKDEVESDLGEKLEKYKDAIRIFRSVCHYKGQHSAIIHGDCWSNNMMFKYSNTNGLKKKLVDVCLLDWQIASLGTPVFDLSYFLYSSSGKDVLDELDTLLEVYYDSFSTTLKEMGGDPAVQYPFSALKADWKEYSKFGLILGILLQRMKLIKNEEIVDLTDIKDDNSEEVKTKFFNTTFDKDRFEERAKNLVLHMYEIDAL